MIRITAERKISFALYAKNHLSSFSIVGISGLGTTWLESDFSRGGCDAHVASNSRYGVVLQTFF
jgi:hypothetical protein